MILLTVKLCSSSIREERAHDRVHVAPPQVILHHVGQHISEDLVQSSCFLVQEYCGLSQEAVQVSLSTHFLLEIHRLHILVTDRIKE